MLLSALFFLLFCNSFSCKSKVANWSLKYAKQHRKQAFARWKFSKSFHFFNCRYFAFDYARFDFKSFVLFSKLLRTLAGATTSSVLNAIAFGPVKKSFKPSSSACSTARRVIVFLYTLNSTLASRSCLRSSVTSATLRPR